MNDGWSDLQWQLWQRERIVMYESDVWESGFLSKYENSCKLIWSFAITVKYERKWFSLVNVDSRRCYRWLETTASNAKVTHLPQWYRIYSKSGATEHNYEHVGCNNCRWRQANCKCPGVRGHRPTNDVILAQSETRIFITKIASEIGRFTTSRGITFTEPRSSTIACSDSLQRSLASLNRTR